MHLDSIIFDFFGDNLVMAKKGKYRRDLKNKSAGSSKNDCLGRAEIQSLKDELLALSPEECKRFIGEFVERIVSK